MKTMQITITDETAQVLAEMAANDFRTQTQEAAYIVTQVTQSVLESAAVGSLADLASAGFIKDEPGDDAPVSPV